MMALTSVVSASLMKGQSEEFAVLVVIGVLLLGLLIGTINGAVVVATRVPDIVVTLAMSFVWAGCALLVLKTPGGGSAVWLKDLITGSVLSEWIPKAAVVLIVIVGLIWLPLRRSRLGLSIYAIGSNQLAAFRSGVAVGPTWGGMLPAVSRGTRALARRVLAERRAVGGLAHVYLSDSEKPRVQVARATNRLRECTGAC